MCVANITIFRVNSCLSTDGASFIYDGTPLVKQSVDHVRTLSHKLRVLLRDVTHREPRSCTCLSTIVSDPSASLKDPRRRSEPSISACTTNRLQKNIASFGGDPRKVCPHTVALLP